MIAPVQKTKSIRALLALHIAVLLFGTAGVFGKILLVPATILVFGRTFFAAITLAFFQRERIFIADTTPLWAMGLCGLLLAIHWLLFFQAIIVSSVAIGLMGFASFPIFVAWLEPLWLKEKRNKFDWLASLTVVFGLWLLLPSGWVMGNVTLGLCIGIASGFCFALLVIVNRGFMQKAEPAQLAFWQNAFAATVLLPFLPWRLTLSLPPMTWVGLIVMGVVFTALSHTLFLYSLKKISAHFAAVISTLEPVYGVILAMFILDETLSINELIGMIFILGTTCLMTVVQAKSKT